MVLEVERSKNMVLPSAQHLVRAFLLQHDLVEGSTGSDRASVLTLISLPLILKPLMLLGGPTLMTSSYSDYFSKAPPANISICILGLRFQYLNFWGT